MRRSQRRTRCYNGAVMTLPAVVLYQPQIPPNAGNIIRLCANTGAPLHLIEPLGFRLDDAQLRRAGLDYHEFTRVHQYNSLQDYIITCRPREIYGFSAHGSVRYDRVAYGAPDALVFGPETSGLTEDAWAAMPQAKRMYIPMLPASRSMNLANSVAVVLFEAWRQQDFAGAAGG